MDALTNALLNRQEGMGQPGLGMPMLAARDQAAPAQPPTPTAPKPEQVAAGAKALQALIERSKQATPPPTAQPAAPPIDTSGIMNFLASLKNRAKYAMFGPEGKVQNAAPEGKQ